MSDEMPYLQFKNSRIEEQWKGGGIIHPALRVIVNAAALWHWRATGRPAVLTCVLRTRQEQRAIYPDQPERRSPHEFGRAVDLRTRDLDQDGARAWEAWINSAFAYLGHSGARTALLHEVNSLGGHLHVQAGPSETVPVLLKTTEKLKEATDR
jgi:hypothetical protein